MPELKITGATFVETCMGFSGGRANKEDVRSMNVAVEGCSWGEEGGKLLWRRRLWTGRGRLRLYAHLQNGCGEDRDVTAFCSLSVLSEIQWLRQNPGAEEKKRPWKASSSQTCRKSWGPDTTYLIRWMAPMKLGLVVTVPSSRFPGPDILSNHPTSTKSANKRPTRSFSRYRRGDLQLLCREESVSIITPMRCD